MNVADWALRRRTLVLLVFACLAAAGILAGTRLASGIYPEVDFPRIGVVIRQGDTPPAVFHTNVVRPLEQELATVLGVERIRTRTIRGGAEIALLFAPDSDMWRALQRVQSAVADSRPALPPDAVVHVERLTPVSFPVLTFNLTGANDLRVLNETARFLIAPRIARIRGVGRVGVLGGDVREMEILVDPERASAAHLRLSDIAAKVRVSIPLASVGRIERDRALVSVMATAEATGPADLERIPVGVDAHGAPVLLSAVAEVREGAEDRYFRTSSPGGEAVQLSVARAEGASTPDVVAEVLASVEALRPSLPRGVRIEPVYDQGHLVRASITSVRDAILLGVVLCLLVIGVFLRDARAGFVASVAVPLTLAITFLAMSLAGQTLNLMSLGGMAVSIGLVVDDAIVIVEAIARRLAAGDDPRTAAVEGTRELSAAVVGTTVTTVIVFLPLAFLPGIVGTFFGELAITLASAVIISLLVALFVIPIVAARVMRRRSESTEPSAFERRIGRLVAWSSNHGALGVVGCTAALAFVGFAADRVPSGFMPACDEGSFVIDYETPAGTSLVETDRLARRIETILQRTPEVQTYSRRTGAEVGPATVTLLNSGDFIVRLRNVRDRDASEVMEDVRGRIESSVPGVRVEFIELLRDMLNDLAGAPHPIEVKLFGEDEAVLERLAHETTAAIGNVHGLVDLSDGLERPSAELRLSLDRIRIAHLGLTPDDVTHEVAAAMSGTQVGTVRRFDRTLGIRLRLQDAVRHDPARLEGLPIATGSGGVVSLRSVAELRTVTAPTLVFHEGLEPVVIVHADHEGSDLGGVVRDVERAMGRVRFPRGYRYELGGQYAEQQASRASLARVAMVGLLLVLTVLVGQFRRASSAVAVMLTAPLSLVGALIALVLTGTPLDASSSMGCVLLVGLVVKNGILLVEVAEEHMASGVPLDRAFALAGERRIRPIAMTTLATLFGLLPLALALGAGAELQKPLAVAVIGGLSLSTVASLVVLPALVGAFDRLGRRFAAGNVGALDASG